CETLPNIDAYLDHELTKPGAKATTLLIDEVEDIWSEIAEKDDWSAFENKIEQIREYGKLQKLLTA
ncbi:MAG: hypothetical protein ABJL73_13170, partial [Lentilitoribacter sp.]